MIESLHIRVLVFSHPHHPDAGIQVPAGTVKEGETPKEVVLREAIEETGLKELKIRSFLVLRRDFDLVSF